MIRARAKVRMWRRALLLGWKSRGWRGPIRELATAVADLESVVEYEAQEIRNEAELELRSIGDRIEDLERTLDQALSRIED